MHTTSTESVKASLPPLVLQKSTGGSVGEPVNVPMVFVPLHSLHQLFGTSYLTISEIRHSPFTFSIVILKLSCLLITDDARAL